MPQPACSPSRSRSLRSARCRPTISSSRDCQTTGARSRATVTPATFLRVVREAHWRDRPAAALAERDGASILHGARGEVGHGDDVELAERILDAEVLVVERQLLFSGLERERRSGARLSGVEQTRIGMPSDAPSRQTKSPTSIADEVGRHLRRASRTSTCACRGSGPGVSESCLPLEIAVSPASTISDDVEGRLVGRLVERRKRAPRIGRLHLRDGVASGRLPC